MIFYGGSRFFYSYLRTDRGLLNCHKLYGEYTKMHSFHELL